MHKFLFIPGMTALMIGTFCINSLAASISINSLIEEGVSNNPRIQQAHSRWKEAEFKAQVAGSLEDPVGNYGVFGEEIQTRVGPQEQKFGISQKIPFPGKLDLKQKAQESRALALKENYNAAVSETVKNIQLTYYSLFQTDKNLQITDEEKGIWEQAIGVIQRKYESNRAQQQDVVKAQVELSKIIEKELMLKSQRQSLVQKMSYLLGRKEVQDFPPLLEIDKREFNYTSQEIESRAESDRQELRAAKHALESAEHEKKLAQMSYLPDVKFGFEYIEIGDGSTIARNDGDDAWMGVISFNIPVWFGRIEADIRSKKAGLEAAKSENAEMQNRVQFEAQELYAELAAYKEITVLYETALIPQSKQAFDASQYGFETGSVTFLDWLDAERTYLKTRFAYCKALTDYHKTLVKLERAAGGGL